MRNLVKISAFLMLLFMGSHVSAQDVNIGAKAGLDFSNHGGDVNDMDVKMGFLVGLTFDYEMENNLYLLTGFDLISKGARKKVLGVKTKTNPLYFQLPVHAGYKLNISDEVRVVFSAGPYFAFGVGGKDKVKTGKTVVKNDFFGSEEEGGMKRFDLGLGLALGLEFDMYKISLGYDFGLSNISYSSSHKVKNENVYLTLGRFF